MPLLCEKRGHVAILTLSRPEARNAWDEDFNVGLEAQLSALEHDHEIRCVILTGDEKGASGKYDLTNFERNVVRFKVGYDF